MPRRLEKLFILAGFVAVCGILFTAVMQELTRRKGPEPLVALKISAVRTPAGLDITSHEDTNIDDCQAMVFGEGNAIWTASAPDHVAQSQTFHVAWSAFKSNDQPLSAEVGLKRPLLSVSCLVDDKRRSAGVTFESPADPLPAAGGTAR
jgi:hypothetical protein